MTDPSPMDALTAEVMALEVKFHARGLRREDGLTAAEVEAELAAAHRQER